MGLKRWPKSDKKRGPRAISFQESSQACPKRLKRDPKEAQERPKRGQERPKSAQEMPKRTQRSPVGAKIGPRMHQKAEKHRSSPRQSKRGKTHTKLNLEIFHNRYPKALQN